jgi:type II restriction enzyme
MCRAIQQDRTPNLLALHYDPSSWSVQDLILIPRFAFSLSLLEKRKPLAPTARRAGWIGCTILLSRVPLDAQIVLVWRGQMSSHKEVRRRYARLRPLEELGVEKRGWTLDVLNAIRSLQKFDFTLAELYAAETQLARLHPQNRHVRDKIRQQLQVLRDMGLLEFLGAGRYRHL